MNFSIKFIIKFIKIREPGGSLNSEKIRKLLLNQNSNFKYLTDLFLYMASRNENFHKNKNFLRHVAPVNPKIGESGL